MVKVRNTRPVKKCINPESCKKLALILTCYHCASTRVKHLAEIQDCSQTSNYTGIKKCLICSSLECRLELHNWNTRCGQWGTKVPVSLTDLFSIHSPLQTIRFPTVNNHVLLVHISKKTLTKKKCAHSKEKPDWKALFQAKAEKKYYVDLTVKKSKEPVEKSNRAGIAGKCSCLPALYYIGDNWIHNSDFASHINKFLLSINKQTKLNQLHILSIWRWCIEDSRARNLLVPTLLIWTQGNPQYQKTMGGEGVGDYPSWVTKNNAHKYSLNLFMLDCRGLWEISSCCVLVHRCMIIRIVQPYTVTNYSLTAGIIYSFTIYLKYIIFTIFLIFLVFMIQLLKLCLCRAEE